MKKLIATLGLALAWATTAHAQSGVSISGNWDAGYSSLNSQVNTADKQDVIANGSSTSFIRFSATEDLGNGLTARFVGQTLISTVSGQTGNGASAFSQNNFFNDEVWVGLDSRQFGSIKFGQPNAGMFETNARSQPFGTALGGGYSATGINRLLGSTGTLGVYNYVGGVTAGGRVIRHEKSVRYDTPVWGGLSANVTHSFMNDNSTTATSNNNGFTDMTVNFSRGPLNLSYSNAKASAGDQRAQGNNAAGALTPNSDVDYKFFAANYKIGKTDLFYGQTSGRTYGLANDRNVRSQNVAVRRALTDKIDLLANYVKVDDRSATAQVDQDLRAVSAIYNFSKRTNTYVTYQTYDTDKSNADTGKVDQYIVGLRHRF